jgi:tRNA nucleotidyltransferase (CCA-adding enzyme)
MMAAVGAGSGDDLLARFAALPAARPLLERLRGTDGVYLVGGAVRDLWRGAEPGDLDLVVDGDPASVIARLGPPDRIHDRFGTCTVVIEGFSYDLARARRETYARPGALPAVTPAPIDIDLARRDFTVNAVALGLAGRRRGTLLTVPGAIDDLRDGRLRVLHDASFVDDPTRLLRLARYAARLGFAIEDGTRALALAAVADGALQTVSGARVGAELRLLAAEPDPVAAVAALGPLDLGAAIAPGFGLCSPEAAARALALLPADGERGALVLATAALHVAPALLRAALEDLAFPAGARERIVTAATRAEPMARVLGAARRPSEIATAAGGAPAELIALAGAIGTPAAASAARRWLSGLRDVRLEIDGDDLVAAGIAPGPAVGAGLRDALAARLDGRVAGRAQELEEALRSARQGH